jgi:hypothetical protein
MSDKAFNEAESKDRIHFIKCQACGEMLDMRCLDEVFKHEGDHKERSDIQYTGSKRIK